MDCEQSFAEVDDLLAMVQFGDQKCLHFSHQLHKLEESLTQRIEGINFVVFMQQLHGLQASIDSTRQALKKWEYRALAYLQQLHQVVCGTSQEKQHIDYQNVEYKITSLLKIIKTQHQGLLDKQKRSQRLSVIIVERKQKRNHLLL